MDFEYLQLLIPGLGTNLCEMHFCIASYTEPGFRLNNDEIDKRLSKKNGHEA